MQPVSLKFAFYCIACIALAIAGKDYYKILGNILGFNWIERLNSMHAIVSFRPDLFIIISNINFNDIICIYMYK